MFAIALAATLAASPDGPGFRFELRGAPGTTVAVTASAPHGWLAAFCSRSVCSIGHVSVTIPKSGLASLDLHMHNIASGAHGDVRVSAEGKSLALPI
jgi:hypothetical protein